LYLIKPINFLTFLLSQWVMVQRREKKKYETGSKTAMTDEKLQHLSNMDFQWSVRKEHEDAMWNQRYGELTKFKDEHGHCRVAKQSGKLGVWEMNMRSTAQRPKSKERIAKLDAIGLFD
jgi:predicted ATP-binding protein involved in virulence